MGFRSFSNVVSHLFTAFVLSQLSPVKISLNIQRTVCQISESNCFSSINRTDDRNRFVTFTVQGNYCDMYTCRFSKYVVVTPALLSPHFRHSCAYILTSKYNVLYPFFHIFTDMVIPICP